MVSRIGSTRQCHALTRAPYSQAISSRGADGRIQIELMGLDIYDPTTGQIRSSSTADIACWFIDTNYNGESFFVRHAYFTGTDRPYENQRVSFWAYLQDRVAGLNVIPSLAELIRRPATP